MLYYLYYGYMGYMVMRYTPALEMTYYTFWFGNKFRHWMLDKKEIEMIKCQDDWVLCDSDDNILIK